MSRNSDKRRERKPERPEEAGKMAHQPYLKIRCLWKKLMCCFHVMGHVVERNNAFPILPLLLTVNTQTIIPTVLHTQSDVLWSKITFLFWWCLYLFCEISWLSRTNVFLCVLSAFIITAMVCQRHCLTSACVATLLTWLSRWNPFPW